MWILHLAFVVGGAAVKILPSRTVESKRGRGPEDRGSSAGCVVVSVEKDGGLARGLERFRIHQGVKIRWNDVNRFKSGGSELPGGPACSALDVRFVLALGADAGDAKKFAQFRQMLIAATLYKFCKVSIRPQVCESLRYEYDSDNCELLRPGKKCGTTFESSRSRLQDILWPYGGSHTRLRRQ